jgi:hypothetical protein
MTRRYFMMYPDNSQRKSNHDDDIYDVAHSLDFNSKYILIRFIIGLWNTIKKIPSFILFLFAVLYSLFGYYIMWISLHYAAVHMYPKYCAPLTFIGFVLSPFMVSAPHCIAMRWLIIEGSNVIVTMWVAIGAYAIQTLLKCHNSPAQLPAQVPSQVPSQVPAQAPSQVPAPVLVPDPAQ